jgi:hypothetical protein
MFFLGVISDPGRESPSLGTLYRKVSSSISYPANFCNCIKKQWRALLYIIPHKTYTNTAALDQGGR